MSLLAALLVLPVAIALRGWVLMCFWGWFVTPVFALPSLGLMQAVGLAVAAAAFTDSGAGGFRLKAVAEAVGAKEPTIGEAALQGLIYPLVMLAAGWVVHLFM